MTVVFSFLHFYSNNLYRAQLYINGRLPPPCLQSSPSTRQPPLPDRQWLPSEYLSTLPSSIRPATFGVGPCSPVRSRGRSALLHHYAYQSDVPQIGRGRGFTLRPPQPQPVAASCGRGVYRRSDPNPQWDTIVPTTSIDTLPISTSSTTPCDPVMPSRDSSPDTSDRSATDAATSGNVAAVIDDLASLSISGQHTHADTGSSVPNTSTAVQPSPPVVSTRSSRSVYVQTTWELNDPSYSTLRADSSFGSTAQTYRPSGRSPTAHRPVRKYYVLPQVNSKKKKRIL